MKEVPVAAEVARLRVLADQIAGRAGFGPVRLEVRPCRGGGKAIRPDRVVVDPTFAAAPPGVAAAVIAHEIGHLVTMPRLRAARDYRDRVADAALACWVLLAVTAGCVFLRDLPRGPDGADHAGLLALLGAATFVLLAPAAARSRDREYAADAFATEVGHPPTTEVAAWYAQHHPARPTPRWLRPAERALATHPTWPQRITAATNAGDPAPGDRT
jgi:Zn-dependent protease with chaperone function